LAPNSFIPLRFESVSLSLNSNGSGCLCRFESVGLRREDATAASASCAMSASSSPSRPVTAKDALFRLLEGDKVEGPAWEETVVTPYKALAGDVGADLRRSLVAAEPTGVTDR